MTDGDINNEISTSLASPSTFFPSLERFYLENCPNLKGWWRRDIVDKGKEATATSTIPLPSFPRLSFFSFWDCPKMTTWMPLFPNLEGLYMINTSWKPLEQTIEMKTMNTASSFPSSSSSPLSKLKDLYLREMQDLESLPEEWLKSLTSLKRLEIWECPNLTSVPEGMSQLTSLQTLHICGCPQLEQRCEKENGEDWANISHFPGMFFTLLEIFFFFLRTSFYLLQQWYFGQFICNSRRSILNAQAKPNLKKKQNFMFSFSPVSFSSPRNSLGFWMCDWCWNCRKNNSI